MKFVFDINPTRLLRKVFFPAFILFMGWAFFISPNFEQIAAGVAILLFGMILLEEGFNAFVKGPLQRLLQIATDKLYKSIGLGFVVTAIMQSSSLVSIVSISFISAGLIGLKSGIGIIFGANLGTTATAWIVSLFGLKFKVSALALPLLAFGIIFVFQKSKQLKGVGNILAGLGFFFLGIFFMKEGFNAYHDSINFTSFNVTGFGGIIVFSFIGIIITLILQSSSAAMALILTALASNQITYENSLALAVGANIGTTITALIGSIGANLSGKKLAIAHLIFNLTTGVVAIALIIPLQLVVDYLAELISISTENYVIKLSIFHTLFNLLGILILVPFIDTLVKFLDKNFVSEIDYDKRIEQPVFLNESVLSYPQTALKALLDESKRLFEQATFNVVSHGLNLHRKDILSQESLKIVLQKSRVEVPINIDDYYYQKVKIIYGKIVKYATIAQGEPSLSEPMVEAFSQVKLANRNMVEIIKNIRGLQKNVNFYINSNNPFIQEEYDQLRHSVSIVLREIYATQNAEHPESHLEKLEHLKSKSKHGDALLNGSLDHLIREGKITSVMATSLANDSALVAHVNRLLIDTAELLYIQRDTILRLSNNELNNTNEK